MWRNSMKNAAFQVAWLAIFAFCTQSMPAGETLPTPEHPVGWRNDGTGHYPEAKPPVEWSQTVSNGVVTSKNIAWRVRIPSHGASSPIVVGDRIFITGGGDTGTAPMDVMCLNRHDGRLLWMKSLTYYDTISAADKTNLLSLRLELDAARDKNIFLVANRKLGDNASAEGNYEIPGAKVVRAEMIGDSGQIVKLTLAESLKTGQAFTLELKGIKGADGQVNNSKLKGMALPGRPVTQSPVEDFLIGGHRTSDLGKDLIGEATVRPALGAEWKALRGQGGLIDLTRIVGPRRPYTHPALAYAGVYLYSEVPQTVQLWFGSSYEFSVRVNGTAVYKTPYYARRTVQGQDKVKGVELKQGWNFVLIRHGIDWMGAEWKFIMQVMDKDGQAAPQGLYYAAGGDGESDLTPFYAAIPVPKDFAATVENEAVPLAGKFHGMSDELVAKVNAITPSARTDLYPTQFPILLPAWPRMNHPPLPKSNPAEVEFNRARYDLAAKLNGLCAAYDPVRYQPVSLNECGCASPTPCSDGTNVFVYFANRIAACFDLNGNCKWARLRPESGVPGGGHGLHNSPLLAEGILVLPMYEFLGCDSKTGGILWNASPEAQRLGTCEEGGGNNTILTATSKGSALATSTGQGYFLTNGRTAWCRQPMNGISPSSVVVQDGTICVFQSEGIYTAPIPANPGKEAKLDVKSVIRPRDLAALKVEGGPITYTGEKGNPQKAYDLYAISSPLLVDGLLYCVTAPGVLIVLDVKENKVVYMRILDRKVVWPGLSASLALAGGNIYIVSSEGTTLIIKPGRVYQEVAHSSIESLYNDKGDREKFLASPVFAGKQLLLRGEMYLYSIGE